jgi:pimeloyl-ACP methyl ester carboxylesterase
LKSAHGLWLLLLLVGSGCSSVPHRVASAPPSGAPEPQVIVFSVDGAGNFQGISNACKDWVHQDNLPIHIHTFEWSHGYRRIFADHLDMCHGRREGQKLAEQIRCYCRDTPTALPVYIIAHSAGSLPALVAAEYLPPDCVERIILLAPSVSAKYDLRPALRCARQGVEVFHSRRDRGYLGLGMAVFGTTDRRRSAVSGRIGFRAPNDDGCDAALFARLHQHEWHESMSWTGYTGGHFTIQKTDFLRAYVRPLLLETEPPPPATPVDG